MRIGASVNAFFNFLKVSLAASVHSNGGLALPVALLVALLSWADCLSRSVIGALIFAYFLKTLTS